jgi:choline dehydrogenase-like flavoprotein
MNNSQFDAEFIVIGSGPAGVSASVPLVEAGRRVLMLDGTADPYRSKRSRENGARWQRVLGDRLEALQPDDGLSPKLRTSESRSVVDAFRTWADIKENDFFAIGALARGGLSRIWGSLVSEFDQADLHSWPIRVAELVPSYRAVAARIGLSGSSDDDMAEFYGLSGPVLPAPPIGQTAAIVLKNYLKRSRASGFALGLARNALLTVNHGDRPACDLSLDCLWGCRRGAIYDACRDLDALRKSPHFRLIDDAVVTRLAPVEHGWNAIIRGRDQPFRAPRILVAAGALGTLRLMAPLLGDERTELRLLNSPLLALPMLLPARIAGNPSRIGHTLAQLGFSYAYSPEPGEYVTGTLYEVSALPPSSFVTRLPFGRRAGTEIFRALSPALIVASIYFPGTCSANTVSTHRDGDDVSIAIRGALCEAFAPLNRAIQRALTKVFRGLGAFALPSAELAKPGTDAHLGGLFPMGGNERNGTDSVGELNGCKGLYLVDGSVLPTMPSKPNTLTIMANADRIARHLAKLA